MNQTVKRANELAIIGKLDQFYNDNLLQNIILFLEFCICIYILTQQRFKLDFAKT